MNVISQSARLSARCERRFESIHSSIDQELTRSLAHLAPTFADNPIRVRRLLLIEATLRERASRAYYELGITGWSAVQEGIAIPIQRQHTFSELRRPGCWIPLLTIDPPRQLTALHYLFRLHGIISKISLKSDHPESASPKSRALNRVIRITAAMLSAMNASTFSSTLDLRLPFIDCLTTIAGSFTSPGLPPIEISIISAWISSVCDFSLFFMLNSGRSWYGCRPIVPGASHGKNPELA